MKIQEKDLYHGAALAQIVGHPTFKAINTMRHDVKFWELICDHISGMTDDYAQDRFERFYTPFKMVTND
jgi:dGTP triphosphohydrolase